MTTRHSSWTTKSIQSIKPKDSPYRQFERGDIPGFNVQVLPSGTLSPSLQCQINGKRKFVPLGKKINPAKLPRHDAQRLLGQWLKEMRRTAEDLREKHENKEDITDFGKPVPAIAVGTVDQLLDVYLSTLEGATTYSRIVRDLKRDIRPSLGKLPANKVTPEEISDVLAGLYDRAMSAGHTGDSSIRKIRGSLRKAYQIGLTFDANSKLKAKHKKLRFRINANPVDSVPAPAMAKPRERALTREELHKVWKATYQLKDDRIGAAFRLMVLTGHRRSSIAGLLWNELEGGTMFIPGTAKGRNKSKRDHRLPITRLMKHEFDQIEQVSAFVFSRPDRFRGQGWLPLNPQRITDMCPVLASLADVESFTPHDIRRTVITSLKRVRLPGDRRIDGETRRLIANHSIQQDVHDDYDRTDWHDQKAAVTEALEAWHQDLQQIINPKPTPISKHG